MSSGGGDWAADRLIPDAIRAFSAGEELRIRHPDAIRPWQHVLEPIRGYVKLAEFLAADERGFRGGWNFGPADADVRTVHEVVGMLVKRWGEGAGVAIDSSRHPHEAGLLKLDCSKAERQLGWKPKLDLKKALTWTVEWHKIWLAGSQDMQSLTAGQIQRSRELAEATSPD